MADNNEQNTTAHDVKKRGRIPHWMKNVESTPDLVLRYQLRTKELQDTLQSDLRVLREINQVNIFSFCFFFLVSNLCFKLVINDFDL